MVEWRSITLINTLDQPLLFTEHSEHTLVDNQHSITSWSTVCQESTKFWLTHISQLTIGWLSTNCWSGSIKSWPSIIWDVYWVLRFWSRVCTPLRMPLAHDPIVSRPLSKQMWNTTFLQHSLEFKASSTIHNDHTRDNIAEKVCFRNILEWAE